VTSRRFADISGSAGLCAALVVERSRHVPFVPRLFFREQRGQSRERLLAFGCIGNGRRDRLDTLEACHTPSVSFELRLHRRAREQREAITALELFAIPFLSFDSRLLTRPLVRVRAWLRRVGRVDFVAALSVLAGRGSMRCVALTSLAIGCGRFAASFTLCTRAGPLV
jgi:hypothetical protein